MKNSKPNDYKKKNNEPNFRCQICGEYFPLKHVYSASLVRNSILEEIYSKHLDWDTSGYICISDLDKFRTNHIEKLLQDEQGALSRLENEVVKSYREHELLTENINKQINAKFSFGERIADKVASFGGSWPFICLFIAVLLTWIVINVTFVSKNPFDPYPFILLNLVLSCLAAIQAPVIMMSQNRQSKKERIKSDYEYMINLKAELEIQHINSKLDQLMREQWSRMLEIQNIQIELIDEIKQILNKD